MAWILHVTGPAQKSLQRLPAKDQARVKAALIAMRNDPLGYVPVLGSMMFFVVGLFLLGASVLVSRNLVENPDAQFAARAKRAVVMLSLTVTVLALSTVFRAIFQMHGR